MYCRYCGREVPEDSEFCSYCGKRLLEDQATPTVEKWDSDSLSADSQKVSTLSDIGKVSSDTVEVTEHTENDKASKSTQRKPRHKALVLTAIALVALFAVSYVLYHANSKQELTGSEMEDIAKSVFMLEVYDEWKNLISTGSAFAALSDHVLVTNFHVIEGGYEIRAISEADDEVDVEYVLCYDQLKDIAVLQISEGENAPAMLPLADPSKAKKGNNVYAIGSPQGLKNSFSTGIISGIWEEDAVSYFQTTAPISSGSSGGVLVNASGEVIGITSASYTSGQNLNIAISIAHVLELYNNKKEPVSIAEFADTARTYGMAPQNVGMFNNVTSSANYLFHNFDYYITRIDKTTGDAKKFNFSGNYINAIFNKLYFVKENHIYSSSFDGTDVAEIPFHLSDYEDPQIQGLFAVRQGLLFGCYENDAYMDTFAYYLLPYDSPLPRKMPYISDTAQFTENGYYTMEGGYLLTSTFAEPDLAKPCFVNIDLDPYNAYYENDTIVYAINDTIFTMDTVTGQTQTLYTAPEGMIKLRAFYAGYVYFHIETESAIPFTVNNPLYVIASGRMPVQIGNGMYPVAMNFANENLFFNDGTATTPVEERCGYMCKLDGSSLEIISKAS